MSTQRIIGILSFLIIALIESSVYCLNSASLLPSTLEQAENLFEKGDYLAAKSKYLEFIDSSKELNIYGDIAYLMLGICEKELGNTEKAKTELQKVIDIYPGSKRFGMAYYEIGKIYAGESNNLKAKESYRSSIASYPDENSATMALEEYANLLVIANDVAITANERDDLIVEGKLSFRDNNFSESRQKYDSFLKKFPSDKNADYVKYQIARSYYREEDYKTSRDELNDFISKFSQSYKIPKAKWLIGYTYLKEDNYDDAKTAFQRVINEHPDDEITKDAMQRYGTIIHRLGEDIYLQDKKALDLPVDKWADSIAVFDQIIAKYPDDMITASDAQMRKAALTFELHKMDGSKSIQESITECDKVLNNYADSAPETLATAKLMKGECYYVQKDYSSAISIFRSAVNKHKSVVKAHKPVAFAQYMIGLCYAENGDYVNAVPEFEALLKEYGDAPNYARRNIQASALMWLGMMKKKLGQDSDAKVDLERLLVDYPTSKVTGSASILLNTIK